MALPDFAVIDAPSRDRAPDADQRQGDRHETNQQDKMESSKTSGEAHGGMREYVLIVDIDQFVPD